MSKLDEELNRMVTNQQWAVGQKITHVERRDTSVRYTFEKGGYFE